MTNIVDAAVIITCMACLDVISIKVWRITVTNQCNDQVFFTVALFAKCEVAKMLGAHTPQVVEQ